MKQAKFEVTITLNKEELEKALEWFCHKEIVQLLEDGARLELRRAINDNETQLQEGSG